MKKKLSIILTVLLTAMVFAPATPVQVNAASKDVTAAMAGNKKVKKISKMVTAYTTAMNLSAASTTKPVTVKMNDKNKLSVAAFVRYNYKEDYSYTAAELRSETKALFGKSVSTAAIKKNTAKSTGMIVCSADKSFVKDPYMYCGGDFGDTIPAYRIKKVVRTGKKTYTVTIENQIRNYGEKGKTSIGTTTLKIKKAANSRYGYTVKGISYQYNGTY